MRSITWFGAFICLFGIFGLAIPVFTTFNPGLSSRWVISKFRAQSNPPTSFLKR